MKIAYKGKEYLASTFHREVTVKCVDKDGYPVGRRKLKRGSKRAEKILELAKAQEAVSP